MHVLCNHVDANLLTQLDADQPVKTEEKTLGARVVPKKHWDQNCCEGLRNCKLYYLSHFLLFDLCTFVNIEIRSRFLFWELHT